MLRLSATAASFPARHQAIAPRRLRLSQAGLFLSTALRHADNSRSRVEEGANRACGYERPTKRAIRPIAQQLSFVEGYHGPASECPVQEPDIAGWQDHALVPVSAPLLAQPSTPLPPRSARQLGQSSRCLGDLVGANRASWWLGSCENSRARCKLSFGGFDGALIFGAVATSWKHGFCGRCRWLGNARSGFGLLVVCATAGARISPPRKLILSHLRRLRIDLRPLAVCWY